MMRLIASPKTTLMGGKACIRGMRVTVGMVVRQISAGHSIEELLTDYPIWSAKAFCKHFDMPLIERRVLPGMPESGVIPSPAAKTSLV
jgi:hypothetical protein